jgi:DNA-binding Xre family transcriptional regulator
MPRKNRRDEIIGAEVSFLVAVQYRIQKLMKTKGVSHKDLAERLGVKEATIRRLLEDRNRLTLRAVARVYWALDEKPVIACQ